MKVISILVLVVLIQVAIADYSIGDKIINTMIEMSEQGIILLSPFEKEILTKKDDVGKFRFFMAKLREIFREKSSYKISGARNIINQFWQDKQALNAIFSMFYKPTEELDFVIQQTLF